MASAGGVGVGASADRLPAARVSQGSGCGGGNAVRVSLRPGSLRGIVSPPVFLVLLPRRFVFCKVHCPYLSQNYPPLADRPTSSRCNTSWIRQEASSAENRGGIERADRLRTARPSNDASGVGTVRAPSGEPPVLRATVAAVAAACILFVVAQLALDFFDGSTARANPASSVQ